LVMPLAAVQQLYELGDRIDRVRVLVDSRDGREDARTAVAARLPASLVVQVPVEQRELAGTILRSTELALRFAGALSLAMAGFIVLNTLRMSFGERRRDMAILRVLGVTAPDLVRLQLVEGVLLGLAGAVLGIPLGVVLGRGLGSVMQSLAGTEAPTAQTPYGLVLAALVVGPLVAALAALVPALQTRGISPAEALGDVEARRGERFPRWSIVAGLVVWSIAVVLLVLVGRESLPAEAAIPAGVLMLVGFIAVIPALLAPLVRSISRALSAWFGAEGGFAAEQLLHRPTRTGLTIGVLVVALSTGVGLGNAITNNVNDVRAWYRRMTAGDIMLAGPSAAHGAVEGRDAQAISERIAATPGVEYVVESRYFPVRAAGVPTTCVVHDFDRRLELPWSVTSEEDRAIRSGLAAGDIVIGGNLAKRLEVSAGDELRVEVQGRVLSLKIAAVVRDYTLGGLAVFYDLAPARKQLELGTAEIFTVAVKSDAEVDGVVQQLKSRLGESGLVVESFADVRQQLDLLIAGIVGALWALLAVGFVIGGVAVGNTLSMSVLEQTRELGLLRIIGMTRGQVRKLVLWESLLLGILGTLLGTLAGLTTAWIIHLCNEPLLGHALPFAFHGWLLAANAGACLVITLLAAWLPGERAARLDLLAAIAYE
jgi:putative ABC transport system permease protein